VTKPRKTKDHPTRIHELAMQRGWTYADVAARVQKIAATEGDQQRLNAQGATINRLATGKIKLTPNWQTILAEVFGVPVEELTSPPSAKVLRRMRVAMSFEAGNFRPTNELPEAEQFNLMVAADRELQSETLYAGEIKGDANNLRYQSGTVIVMSQLTQKPGEIVEGKRYHVRHTRADGLVEDSVRFLTQDKDGSFWLKTESDKPEHQKALRLPSEGVELIGRARMAFTVE